MIFRAKIIYAVVSDYIAVPEGTANVTLSWESESSYYQARIIAYDSSKVLVPNSFSYYQSAGTYTHTFAVPETAKYIRINYSHVLNSAEYPRNNIRVNLGSSDLGFAPYSNICPIIGYTGVNVTRTGKNLLGGHDLGQAIVNAVGDTSISDFGSNQDGDYVIVSRGTDTSRKMFTNGIKFKENTQYTFIMRLSKYVAGSMLSSNFCFEYDDGTVSPITFDETSSSEVVTLRVTTIAGKTLSGISTGFYSGSAYLFYENSGIFEGIITTEEFEEYLGTTYNITFPSEAGTVYGGTLTIYQDGSGTLAVDKVNVDLGTLTWVQFNAGNNRYIWGSRGNENFSFAGKVKVSDDVSPLCSKYIGTTAVQSNAAAYNKGNGYCCFFNGQDNRFYVRDDNLSGMSADEVKIAMSGVQLVYELATPISYTLTAAPQIKTLLGLNHIWTDTGDITNLVYYVDNQNILEEILSEIKPISEEQIDVLI